MIPIALPVLGEAEAEAAARVVRSGWVSQGAEVAAFESAFAKLVEAPYACAVANCTVALHLALIAVGARPGDEIITVSSSFIATANVVRQCGAEPVFVDIGPDDFNIDPEKVAAAFTRRTKAVLCVHQMGMPCDLARIVPLARSHGVPVIEDAACAIGSQILAGSGWQNIGAPHGDIACFSFHPRKVVTTGEGGMLTTRNPEWDRLFRLARQHGMSVSDTARHGSKQILFEDYTIAGYNYRMTDMQAEIGRCQLERLPTLFAARRKLAARYQELLTDTPGILAPSEPDWARSNWQSYPIRLPPRTSQRAVMQSMLDDGVATRRGIMCAHREPAYADIRLRFPLPNSEHARDNSILLPLYSDMSEGVQDHVVSALNAALVTQLSAKTNRVAYVQ